MFREFLITYVLIYCKKKKLNLYKVKNFYFKNEIDFSKFNFNRNGWPIRSDRDFDRIG